MAPVGGLLPAASRRVPRPLLQLNQIGKTMAKLFLCCVALLRIGGVNLTSGAYRKVECAISADGDGHVVFGSGHVSDLCLGRDFSTGYIF